MLCHLTRSLGEFRKAMHEVLDERMAAIDVGIDDLKKNCRDLNERVESLEHHNRKLSTTVESFAEQRCHFGAPRVRW